MPAFLLTLYSVLKVLLLTTFTVLFFLLRVVRFALRLLFFLVRFYHGAFLPYGQGQRSTAFD